MPSMPSVEELRDAGPAEAAKWRFVRRRCVAVFQAHAYREVQPAPLEPPGTAMRTGAGAIALIGGSELRVNPMVSMGRTFAAQSAPFARWMTAGISFNPGALGAFRWRAWQAVSGLLLGAAEPAADAEVAALALAIGADLGLRNAEVVLGTLGTPDDLARYLEATTELRRHTCPDCRSEALRFFSCPNEECLALSENAPSVREFIGVEGLKHHEAVLATLDASGFIVRDEPRLAFGAGRYQRTLIELRARPLDGPAIAVARGGRRDDLIERLGGRPTPAVGLTLGVARLSTCLPGENESWEQPCEVFIAPHGTAARAWALKAAAAERARGFRVEVDLRDVGVDEQLVRADEVRARVVLVVGEAERKKGEVAVRDARTKVTRHVPEETLSAELKRLLR